MVETTGYLQAKTKKKTYLDIDLTSFAKINSKLIIYLNVKHKMIKFQVDNVEYILTLGMAMTC